MKQVLALVALLCCCATPDISWDDAHKLEPEAVQFIQSPNLNYKVRVDFALYFKEENTTIIAGFLDALDAWAEVLPIEPAAFFKHDAPLYPMPNPYKRKGIIKVIIVDIGISNPDQENAIGLWIPESHEIHLDISLRDRNIDFIRSVAKHELGHLFGIRHFVRSEDINATTGNIVLPGNEDPSTYIMWSQLGPKNIGVEISSLEVELAIHGIHDKLRNIFFDSMQGCTYNEE